MIRLGDIIKDTKALDAYEFACISDKIWELGELSDIQEKVSPELFTLHLCINIIGNWQSDGWWYIISERPELVPFVPELLEQLGLPEIKVAFENVIGLFPDFTVFIDDKTYCDIINFLQNSRFKVTEQRLTTIPKEERKKSVQEIRDAINELEELTEPLWAYGSEEDGWHHAVKWIKQHS